MARSPAIFVAAAFWSFACASTGDGDNTSVPPPPKTECPAGFDDCTGAKVCDTDLKASSDHCGLCNHGCGGADCLAGWCDVLAMSPAPERSPSGLAAIPNVGAVWAIDGGAALRKWDSTTDAVATLVTVTPAPQVTTKFVWTIVDETHAYWLNPEEGVLRRTALATPAVEVVVASGVKLFALRGADVLWIDAENKLQARAKAGGDARTLATGLTAPTELVATHQSLGYIDGATLVRFAGDDASKAVRWSPPLPRGAPEGSPPPVPYALKLPENQGPAGEWYDGTGYVAWDLDVSRAHLGYCAVLPDGQCGTENEGTNLTLGRPSPLLLYNDPSGKTLFDAATYDASWFLARASATDALGQVVRWPRSTWPQSGFGKPAAVQGVVASDLAIDPASVFLANIVTGQVQRIVR